MIIGTAGHIDHGKTTLVRALTGTDADRLPEEKKRGLTIDLGYAFMDTPDGERLAFIDVPGHERLVATMVAGASGIDFALLLVAADDGPMPQTREHLAVLSLLGMARGAVIITKSDRADAQRIEAVRQEMQGLLAGTTLAGVPMLAVSAETGAGMQPLRQLLFEAAASQPGTDTGAQARAFRLAIDRVFTLPGPGTVVTGTVHAGMVSVGDELALAPAAPGSRQRVRVRSLHAQNQPVQQASRGQRCAIAVAGIAREHIQRGQWLCAPVVALATHRIDVRLQLWSGEGKPLQSGQQVQAHIGATHAIGSIALLGGDRLAPGDTAIAQLVLHTDVAAWHGERMLLRDAAATRTLAGAVVLDPFAPGRYRRTPQRLQQLGALQAPTAQQRLLALLGATPNGVDLQQFTAAQGLAQRPDAASMGADPLVCDGLALAPDAAAGHAGSVLRALQAFHQQQPDELGPARSRLRRLAAPRLPDALWLGLLERMAAQGQILLHGPLVHLATHAVQLSSTEARIAQQITPLLREAGFQGAWVRDLAGQIHESEPLMRTTLARIARRGELHQVVKDLYFLPETMERLAALARRVAADHDSQVQAAHFRDATGLGRKRAIQILEYFDRVGLTRRVGDTHRLRPDGALFMPA